MDVQYVFCTLHTHTHTQKERASLLHWWCSEMEKRVVCFPTLASKLSASSAVICTPHPSPSPSPSTCTPHPSHPLPPPPAPPTPPIPFPLPLPLHLQPTPTPPQICKRNFRFPLLFFKGRIQCLKLTNFCLFFFFLSFFLSFFLFYFYFFKAESNVWFWLITSHIFWAALKFSVFGNLATVVFH